MQTTKTKLLKVNVLGEARQRITGVDERTRICTVAWVLRLVLLDFPWSEW